MIPGEVGLNLNLGPIDIGSLPLQNMHCTNVESIIHWTSRAMAARQRATLSRNRRLPHVFNTSK